ncbi:hypothetical protein EMIHUDRAFT_204403 [Emiliania huxleyi CCMP1516]|uniref:HAT C-terminal dimerisation domain-containing protein n=2 Tax=Emiliania huxleyi TaxID=2903 RepID=A0A0D3JYC4_EMIH1|nr:hypothetical protein EMIHUDRAFT_204403 [Emiliania huxleyi CCMP1516]EOD28509.1 hypothetical protein EMIHUDRAFT_204403 [Emiliania huxleyi CCMP1516]|eukprot:XP_005780938.1 hypothetical protein EMIHUDRAFT_204403 [Emiliania huxleyi CCMP1516]
MVALFREFLQADIWADLVSILFAGGEEEIFRVVKGPKNILHAAFTQLNFTGIKKEVAPADSTPVLDEQYLAESEESARARRARVVEKAKETKWPALAKMVKQYFAAPASSAGVERVFSAAGKMHGDLQKSAKDTTLEHSLFAAFNTE